MMRNNRPVPVRRAAIESLESRRYLTLLCSLNGGVLTVQETSDGVNNVTMLAAGNGSIQISETADTMNENQALHNDGWRVKHTDLSARPDRKPASAGLWSLPMIARTL